MDKVVKSKRGLELVISHSSGYETSSEKFLCYILSDQVWWCNVKRFLSYSKNYICKFMQVNSWHHKLFHFYLSFWICKVWKGREKITKIWISWKQKELFRWNKNFFVVFKELLFEEKIKIWKKTADISFNNYMLGHDKLISCLANNYKNSHCDAFYLPQKYWCTFFS